MLSRWKEETSRKELCRGDLVEVRSPGEILATLDAQGEMAGLPFMPEMAAHCGRRFRVDRRADRICDTVHYSGSRRLCDAVLLDDLRCDGSGHDGCQAECRFFWKEEWLRRARADAPPPPAFPQGDLAALIERCAKNVRVPGPVNGSESVRYRCQATELPKCTQHIELWDPMGYVREYASGNVSLGHFLTVTSRAVVQEPLRKLGLISEVHVAGTAKKGETFEHLDLKVGEWVRVKSREEIVKTVTPEGRNKGLWFDREMLPYCGGTYRVRQKVVRFIDDHEGKMIVLKNEAVTLDSVVCSGDLSLRRWFCSRAIYPYWRECWLERTEQPAALAAGGGPGAVP